MIDCIDECPFLTHCPTCGSSREEDDEDTDSITDVEGYPLCYFCFVSIRPLDKRAFVEAKDTVLIVCEDCVCGGVVAGELPPNFLKKLV
jgi:hypothetical protein